MLLSVLLGRIRADGLLPAPARGYPDPRENGSRLVTRFETVGIITASAPALSRSRISRSTVRGYLLQIFLLVNCVGFTKMLATAISFSQRHRSTGEACPS
jgi:hypothetical protein